MSALFAAIGAALLTWALMTPGDQIVVAFCGGLILGHAFFRDSPWGAK